MEELLRIENQAARKMLASIQTMIENYDRFWQSRLSESPAVAIVSLIILGLVGFFLLAIALGALTPLGLWTIPVQVLVTYVYLRSTFLQLREHILGPRSNESRNRWPIRRKK